MAVVIENDLIAQERATIEKKIGQLDAERAGYVAEARAILTKAETEKREVTKEENDKADLLIKSAEETRSKIDRYEKSRCGRCRARCRHHFPCDTAIRGAEDVDARVCAARRVVAVVPSHVGQSEVAVWPEGDGFIATSLVGGSSDLFAAELPGRASAVRVVTDDPERPIFRDMHGCDKQALGAPGVRGDRAAIVRDA